MKKIILFFATLLLFSNSNSQTRVSLYEVFTGEDSEPCLLANPTLNNLLAQPSNTPIVIPIKWQVGLPTAPTASWSLFQTNWIESENRKNYYNIVNASNGRLDGQNPIIFGAASESVSSLTGTTIATAASYTTPFTIAMNTNWNGTYSNAVVSVTILSSQSFTSNGSLNFKLVLIEREINFMIAPGMNGEKNFYDVARISYPNWWSGTNLPSNWTVGQSFTFSLSCSVPSYIVDKSQMAFVGYIQDDGNKKVWQAKRSVMVGALPNDAKLAALSIPAFSCANAFNPTITILNQGSNAITAMTLVVSIDGVAQPPFNWNGSLSPLSNTIISLGSYIASHGNHTIDVNISSVSGGDLNTANNKISKESVLIQTFFGGPINQSFTTTATFPPLNWFIINSDQDATWAKGGSGFNGSGSAKFNFHAAVTNGLIDELYLPPSDLSTVNSPTMSFDLAYARFSISSQDTLQVKTSIDCGLTWITIYNKAGSVLETRPPTFSVFTPTANTEWRHEIVNLPIGAANNPNVLIKFVATSNYGNNLYIDNVNLSPNITSIHKNSAEIFKVQLYPNPSNNYANIDVASLTSLKAAINIYNSLGQRLIEKVVQLNQGINTIPLDLTLLDNGIYIVLLNSSDINVIKKLTISK